MANKKTDQPRFDSFRTGIESLLLVQQERRNLVMEELPSRNRKSPLGKANLLGIFRLKLHFHPRLCSNILLNTSHKP
jgi:hypothetical protein